MVVSVQLPKNDPVHSGRIATVASTAVLVWGGNHVSVRDAALVRQIEAEVQANPVTAQPGKWDYPFTSLKHLDDGEPGVHRQPSGEAAALTFKEYLGLDLPCTLRMIDRFDKKRALVVTRIRLVAVRGKHAETRRTWLLTGYSMGADGLLGYGINTAVATDEHVFTRGLDGEWHPVQLPVTGAHTK